MLPALYPADGKNTMTVNDTGGAMANAVWSSLAIQDNNRAQFVVVMRVIATMSVSLLLPQIAQADRPRDFKKQWARCESVEDCVVIPVPCWVDCVNKRYANEAKQLYGDGANMSCVTVSPDWVKPLCQRKSCVCRYGQQPQSKSDTK
jgi:hypothetical protein